MRNPNLTPTTKRVLLVGHWDGTPPDLSGGRTSTDVYEGDPAADSNATEHVLGLVAAGLMGAGSVGSEPHTAAPGVAVEVEVLPLGPAEAFKLGYADAHTQVIIDDRHAQSSEPLGRALRAALDKAHAAGERPSGLRDAPKAEASAQVRAEGSVDSGVGSGAGSGVASGPLGAPSSVVIEAGHSWYHDWGVGLLAGLLDDPSVTDLYAGQSIVDERGYSKALERAEHLLSNLFSDLDIVVAASTTRPLFGVGSPAHLRPDLRPRAAGTGSTPTGLQGHDAHRAHRLTGPGTALATTQMLVRNSLAALAARPSDSGDVLDTRPSDSGGVLTANGSGAAGGAAAVLAALGAHLAPTFELAAAKNALERKIENADLVIIVEPHLDAPEVVDSGLPLIAEIAAQYAKPVVALGSRTTLSSPEKAELGLHGTTILNRRLKGDEAFKDAARRLAQTWLRE